MSIISTTSISVEVEFSRGDHEHEEEHKQDIVDMEATRPGEHETLHGWVAEDIQILQEFCDGMKYQLQFDDHQVFQSLRPWNRKGWASCSFHTIV